MKIEIDYLNYDDLNYIENRIETATNRVKQIIDMPSYSKKTWVINELPYIQEINRIEKGISDIGYYYYQPNGWIPTKEWITSDNLYPIKSFDYKDYNRWLNDLELIENSYDVPVTLWNGPSQVEWGVPSNENWYDASVYVFHEVLYNGEQILYNNEELKILERN